MAYEHKPGGFSLFPNEKKGNDRAPDYKGTGKDLAGNDTQVAAWKKGAFLSCTFKLKEERPQGRPEPKREINDGDIPF